LTIYPDGAIYPCGFFCVLAGPSLNLRDLDAVDDAMVTRLRETCRQRSEVFEKRCPSCEAVIFCEAYCAMSAIRDNHERLCESQRELIKIMRENIPVTVAIANSFLEFIKERRTSGVGRADISNVPGSSGVGACRE
jgi:radical SAM protein with 4Fe4S-binding SPASM domain